MSEEKQIKEMACAICGNNKICVGQGVDKCILHPQMRRYANNAYREGYRKQIEGEWKLEECRCGLFSIDQYFVCSACKQEFIVEGWDYEDLVANAKFCPNCGAHMRKEDEGK